MTHTIATVRAFLQTQRESDEPDEVLAILKQHDGKQLTKRLLAKLPGGEERWKLSQFATKTHTTHLESRDYGRMLIAYQTTNVTIDAAWIEEHNPAYFKGRRERNALRDKHLNIGGGSVAQLMADRLNAYEDAKEKLDAAKADLDSLIEYGKPFSPDQYDWERLCGAREEKKS